MQSILLGIELYALQNNQALGYSGLMSVVGTIIAIRVLYSVSSGPSEYNSFDITLAVNGLRAFKILSLAACVCVCLLAYRIQYSVDYLHFFSLVSVTESWWCVIRIFLSAFVAVAAQLFDSHPAFRLYCLTSLPVILLLDLLSELSLANQVDCIQRGVCAGDKSGAFLLALRDLFSIAFNGACAIFAWWLLPFFGWSRNTMYLPRKEHRTLSRKLDTMNLGPKRIVRIRNGVAVDVGKDEEEMGDAKNIVG